MYLCYDIKGIQQFIFSVPRLCYMIGGSGQISQFDERWAESANRIVGVKRIFTGGGRGVFCCDGEEAQRSLKAAVISEAHRLGFDVRIGVADQFDQVMQQADDLHPFLPPADAMEGFPCSESGLYPVPKTAKKKRNNQRVAVHPIIRERGRVSKDDVLGNRIRDGIEGSLRELHGDRFILEFMRNVNPEPLLDDEDDAVSGTTDGATDERNRSVMLDAVEDRDAALAGQNALGARNRWAVIAMDGNAIGRHFKAICDRLLGNEREVHVIGRVSDALKTITEEALSQALVKIATSWLSSLDHDFAKCTYERRDATRACLVLPIRPILVGGDDLILLCHPALAMEFVTEMASRFEMLSELQGIELQEQIGFNPWQLSGGRLTISAGMLFAKTSLPLHIAIPYAETLLANAKYAFRDCESNNQPIPSAVDWEIVTDSMLDHPKTRRKRDLIFIDDDLRIRLSLTRRPYRMGESIGSERPRISDLEKMVIPKLQKLPTSVRHDLAEALRQPWAKRTRFLLAMAKDKQYRQLMQDLELTPDGMTELPKRWFHAAKADVDPSAESLSTLETDVIDAMSLLDEQHRQNMTTARQA